MKSIFRSGRTDLPLCRAKVNPVIPEVVNQVAFNIIGNDLTITMAAEAGQLELNAFEPIIFYCMFQSIDTLAYAVRTFVEQLRIRHHGPMRRDAAPLVENSIESLRPFLPMWDMRRRRIFPRRPFRPVRL